MDSYFYRKHIHPQMTKLSRRINSKENYFSNRQKKSCAFAVGFYGSKTMEIINKILDNSDHIFIVETKLDGTVFLLIKTYNASNI